MVGLQQALAPSMLDLPVQRKHNSTQTSKNKQSSTKKESMLSSHFSITKPSSTPVSSLSTPQPPSSEEGELIQPIQFQHRLSAYYSNDQLWLGIKIARKPKHTTRLWSHNINGIKRNNNFLQFAENLEALSQFELDFLALTETNLNSSNAYVRDSIDAIARTVLPASRHILSSTINHPTSEPFQFGGTLSISCGSLSPRLASMERDKYGRFTWTQFFGKKTPPSDL